MYLSRNIKHLRRVHQISQTELAEKIGKTKATVSSYELGTSLPPFEVFLQLSEIFQISLDDLAKKDLQQEGGAMSKPRNHKFDRPGNDQSLKDKIKDQRRLIQLLEQRVKMLEQEILRSDPELGKRLGIEK